MEEIRRLKDEHHLNCDPDTTAEQFFDRIDTLEEICLAGYEYSSVFIPVRDDDGLLEGVQETLCAVQDDYDRDDQYWDDRLQTPLPAIMRAEVCGRVPRV